MLLRREQRKLKRGARKPTCVGKRTRKMARLSAGVRNPYSPSGAGADTGAPSFVDEFFQLVREVRLGIEMRRHRFQIAIGVSVMMI